MVAKYALTCVVCSPGMQADTKDERENSSNTDDKAT